MKKLVNVVETNETAFERVIGEQVTFFCMNYIYHGELIGVSEDSVMLKNAAIVYETGNFNEKDFKNIQSLCAEEFYIKKDTIESFGVLENKNSND